MDKYTGKHPIESLMGTTMESIRDMVDVNTVIGDAVNAGNGITVIPVSKVSFGFVSGGGEYAVQDTKNAQNAPQDLPFGGGAGAGVSVNPTGFLVVGDGPVHMLQAQSASPLIHMLEMAPFWLSEIFKNSKKEKADSKHTKSKKTDSDQAEEDDEKNVEVEIPIHNKNSGGHKIFISATPPRPERPDAHGLI